MSEGDAQSVVIPIEAIVGQARACGAARIVVAHNHPSGSSLPSVSDRAATTELIRQARVAGISLVEHLIVTRTGCAGMLAGPTIASVPVPGTVTLREAASPERDASDTVVEGQSLMCHVRRMMRERALRASFLPAVPLGEPGWDMLLELFVHNTESRQIADHALCAASCLPHSTAVRWINEMVARGVVLREPDPSDPRCVFVTLSPDTCDAMRRYLAHIVERPAAVEVAADAGYHARVSAAIRQAIRDTAQTGSAQPDSREVMAALVSVMASVIRSAFRPG